MTFDDARMSAAHSGKCELVGEAVRLFGSVRVRVTGRSMLPSIWPGDTLVIQRRNAQDVETGDILLYCREGRLFAHRVVTGAQGRSGIGVRGDALPNPDDLVPQAEVVGTVSRISRNGKFSRPASRLEYPKRLIGILTWHSDSFAGLVVFVHSICNAAWWRNAWRAA